VTVGHAEAAATRLNLCTGRWTGNSAKHSGRVFDVFIAWTRRGHATLAHRPRSFHRGSTLSKATWRRVATSEVGVRTKFFFTLPL